ncbi:hypothetical protein LSAT2_011833 [Lamellibrachia satsuma]|nr:hypothetical protein LSAT2_011833 [Lamellibrachia satsuma]
MQVVKAVRPGAFLLATFFLLMATSLDGALGATLKKATCVAKCHRQYRICREKCFTDDRCATMLGLCNQFCLDTATQCLAQCEEVDLQHLH